MQKMKLPELLSPAGSPESLTAAVMGGADAVYIGGSMLNARANAKNFDNNEIADAVKYCHSMGVKIYVTLNTAVYDREMDAALKYAAFLYETGADALIVADLGLAARIKKELPAFELHASTQASGHNIAAAEFFAALGFTRMVCARELSESDIKTLAASFVIEIEMFVHGAHCVSHSGQCLLSAVMGGRSGNRGECAQPCRMRYNNSYPLSLKDICLAPHIPSLIDSGVASLKIEGRMKSPHYVYGVTSVYRRLLDEGRAASPAEYSWLASLFSRSGFTDGYFTGKISGDMLGIRSASDKERSKQTESSRHNEFSQSGGRVSANGIKDGGFKYVRDFPLPAVKIPPRNGESAVEAADIAEAVEIPPRNGKSAIALPYTFDLSRISETPPKLPRLGKPSLTARFISAGQIPAEAEGFFDIIYLPLAAYERRRGASGVIMPPVILDRDLPRVSAALQKARELGAGHILVGNAGHIELAKRYGFTIHGDFRLNLFNSPAASVVMSRGLTDFILSPELTLPQIRDIAARYPASAIVYGRLPVMLLEKPLAAASLRDRTGASFPVLPEGGRDVLFNSVPIWMAEPKYRRRLEESNLSRRHFIFSVETNRQCRAVIEAYRNGSESSSAIRRLK